MSARRGAEEETEKRKQKREGKKKRRWETMAALGTRRDVCVLVARQHTARGTAQHSIAPIHPLGTGPNTQQIPPLPDHPSNNYVIDTCLCIRAGSSVTDVMMGSNRRGR